MNVSDFLDVFLLQHEERLQDCRREARGQLSGDELLSEAFLLAHELGEQQGRALDLRDAVDADLLLKGLMRRARQLGRYQRGLSLDAAIGGREEETSLALIDLVRGSAGAGFPDRRGGLAGAFSIGPCLAAPAAVDLRWRRAGAGGLSGVVRAAATGTRGSRYLG